MFKTIHCYKCSNSQETPKEYTEDEKIELEYILDYYDYHAEESKKLKKLIESFKNYAPLEEESFENYYDRICLSIKKIVDYTTLCNFSNGICSLNTIGGCCLRDCKYKSKTGCITKNIHCISWACDTLERKNPDLEDAFFLTNQLANMFYVSSKNSEYISRYCISKEEILKQVLEENLTTKDFFQKYLKGIKKRQEWESKVTANFQNKLNELRR